MGSRPGGALIEPDVDAVAPAGRRVDCLMTNPVRFMPSPRNVSHDRCWCRCWSCVFVPPQAGRALRRMGSWSVQPHRLLLTAACLRLRRSSECCYPCRPIPFSWHHLWFPAYLFATAAGAAAVVLARRAELAFGAEPWAARTNTVPRLLLLGLPLYQWRLRPRSRAPTQSAGDWANHAHWLPGALAGGFARSETFFSTAARRGWHSTACALFVALAAPWRAAAVPAQGAWRRRSLLRAASDLDPPCRAGVSVPRPPSWFAPFSRYAFALLMRSTRR